MDNKKITLREIFRTQSKRTLFVTLVSMFLFISLIAIYNFMLLGSINENIERRGQLAAERSAEDFDDFLSDCTNALSIAEYTLNEYIVNNASDEEMLAYLIQLDASLVHTIRSQTTKLYAYIDGMIFDGKGEIRKPTYVVDERPWYRKAMSDKGNFVIVDPYNDINTGQVLMTISKTMSDGESVISLDVSMERIQTVIEDETLKNNDLTEMVLDSSGSVVAHSDINEYRRNYTQEHGTLGAAVVERLVPGQETYFDFSFGGHRYTAYIEPILGGWHSISIIASSNEYMPIRIMFVVSIVLSVLTLITLIFVIIRSGKQRVIVERMNSQLSSAANIYLSLSDIDLENMTLTQIKDVDPGFVEKVVEEKSNIQDTFNRLMDALPDNPTKDAARRFVDLSTLNDRLGSRESVSLEYMSFEDKWVRARFLASERKPDGTLTHVLWMLEDITAEKRVKARLAEQAEKLTVQLSSAADIYMSLCELNIPDNSVTAIKNVNPAIERAVNSCDHNMQEIFRRIMTGLPESPTKQAAIDFCDLTNIDEKLKDTNTMTVEYLSYGNIWVRGRYVVSERGSDGKITHILWMLENIDAEKRARDKLTEKAEKLTSQLSSAADIYISLCDLDIPNNSAVAIKNANPAIAKAVEAGQNNMQATFNGIMSGLPESPTKQAAIDFCDLTNIDEKLKDTNTVTVEYLSYGNIWVRGRLVVSERDENGKITHVLWMLENIDAEKRARDKLTEKAEKLTSQLSSAADIYISLCDLDIPNNSAVAIKNANPAIAKAVEAGKNGKMQETFFGIMSGLPESPTKQAAIDFCDLSTIGERLKDTNTETVEYLSYGNIWVRGRLVVSERDENGKVTHVLWMLENIDAEKRARDRLSAAAEKFYNQASAIANIYISAYEFDLTNDVFSEVRTVKSRIVEIMGESHSNANAMLRNATENFVDTPYVDVMCEFNDLSTLKERLADIDTITMEYLNNDKLWRRGRFVVSERSSDGAVTHVLGLVEDIDKEHQERDKLSAVAEKLNNQMSSIASIYMSAYDFDLTNDTFSEVRATNSQVIDLVGGNRANAQQTLYAIMAKITDESARDMVHEFMDLSTLDERLSNTKTLTIEYMSNFRKWVRTRFIESERAPDGKLRHVLLVAEDIDKEKKDREALINMSEKAIAANEAKSAFLSNMSHEIRTPINAVLGMNEMVLRESSDPNVITYSENIRTAGNTLLGLINDILDFSKIEAGKMEIIPVDYDLATVLSDLVNMIQTRLDNKGLLLVTDFDRSTPHLLHGDEVRIKQVITNILTNAAKYTEKGSVTFGVTYERIEDEPDSMMLKVSVKDTGIGIKQEDMAKLFSKFERIEEERNRTVEGTGLGMSITQSLLSMMGSRLDVESVYGEGSVFSFSLKQQVRKWDELGDYAEAHKHSIASRKKYQEKFTAPGAHVLVVDDTVMNLLVFTSLLKSTQVKIDTAESGDDGIALALGNKYDIIFLDHMMPHKDGIETLKELKSAVNNPNRDTPVVCLTANAISGARDKYLEAGFTDYLTKPIESARLEEMMYEYLPPEKIKAAAMPVKKAQPKAVLPSAIFKVFELDTVTGIANAGSEEMYLELLRSYAGMMDKYLEETENYWLDGDIPNLTIKLHSLKGASRTIGAEWIRRDARKLEYAARSGDSDTIDSGMELLMFRCRQLAAHLTEILADRNNAESR